MNYLYKGLMVLGIVILLSSSVNAQNQTICRLACPSVHTAGVTGIRVLVDLALGFSFVEREFEPKVVVDCIDKADTDQTATGQIRQEFPLSEDVQNKFIATRVHPAPDGTATNLALRQPGTVAVHCEITVVDPLHESVGVESSCQMLATVHAYYYGDSVGNFQQVNIVPCVNENALNAEVTTTE